MWPILNWLDPEHWGNKWKFMIDYCAAEQVVFMKYDPVQKKKVERKVWKATGQSNSERLQRELRSTVMIRRMREGGAGVDRQIIELPCGPGMTDYVEKERETYDSWQESIVELRARAELAKCEDDLKVYGEAIKALGNAKAAGFETQTRCAGRLP